MQLSAGHLCLFQATTEQLKKIPLPAHYGIAMFWLFSSSSFFFLSFFFFLEKYKTNTTMVLIVTARDTHNTRSIRIWWQREFFFSFLLSHSKRLRRSCEIGSLHHHATSWRQHSKRKVSSVSFDRSSISCAVESLVKPKFFLSDLQACCVNKKKQKNNKKTPKTAFWNASSLFSKSLQYHKKYLF